MEKHIQFLNMYTVGTKSNDINANNLEFYWYGVWNIVLGYWFQSRFLVVPQYVISYKLINRDDKTICKYVKPDFVVTKYSYENDTLKIFFRIVARPFNFYYQLYMLTKSIVFITIFCYYKVWFHTFTYCVIISIY